MRKTVVAAATLAAALSLGAAAHPAAAMPVATPTELGLTSADNGVVQKAAIVCGRWGCRRVWHRRWAWSGPRRRFFAVAPGPSLGWSSPGWGWSSPGMGWSSPGVGWSSPGWGWRQQPGWGWNRW
jgi:hypothetical protein